MSTEDSPTAEVGRVEAEETGLVERPLIERVPSVEDLIERAVQHGISVEGLEKLLGMHERMQATAAHRAFVEAMSAFQAECPVIPKTKVVGEGNWTYRYAPLEVIVANVSPLLRKHGLSYRFDTAFEAEPAAQVVTCFVSHRDGHSESSEFRTPIDSRGSMNAMQKSASAQTYAKRYAFCNALGILTGDEDNDGVSGSGRGSTAGARPPAVVDTRVAAPTVASTSSGGKAGESATPRPLGRHVVRIPRPSQEPQGSDGTPPDSSLVHVGADTVAATPAAPEDDAAKAQLRQSIIEAQMKLLRLRTRYADMPESELWEQATDVSNAMCQMHYNKPLHEMTRWDLERANVRMEQAVAEKLGVTA